MYILTQSGPFENRENKIFEVTVPDLEKQYTDAGCQRHERVYGITYRHGEHTVICPEFRKSGEEAAVIIPEFLIPGRPYLLEVYLYAIDLYSGALEKGQRWAAEETRKRFGLKTFAHTTLGRALKKLADKLQETEPAANPVRSDGAGGDAANQTAEDDNGNAGDAAPAADGDIGGKTADRGIRSARATWPHREMAALHLGGISRCADMRGVVEACHRVAFEFFMRHRRLLL